MQVVKHADHDRLWYPSGVGVVALLHEAIDTLLRIEERWATFIEKQDEMSSLRAAVDEQRRTNEHEADWRSEVEPPGAEHASAVSRALAELVQRWGHGQESD